MLFFLFSCQIDPTVISTESETPPQTVVVSQYEPLPWPKEGVLSTESVPLEKCLDKVPSCQCWFEKNQELCAPQFVSEIIPLPHLMTEQMKQHTWQEECPVALQDLRLLRVLHWTEKGAVRWGEVVLTERVVKDAREIFAQLYQIRFPVHSLKPAVQYNGSDEESMADNNSSAFNCRKVKGTNRWSEHSYGESIDINPLWNPWVRGARIYPKNAGNYVNRELQIAGMINAGDPVVAIFERHGWRWGSQKTGVSDYQHFSRADHETVYEEK